MKLNPIRSRCSCPECGWFDPQEDFAGLHQEVDGSGNTTGGWFDCERCKAHYEWEDFWEAHHGKRMAQNHKVAEADLSGENE